MGLTKNYLKYSPAGICNIIGSSWAGVEVLPAGTLSEYKDTNTLVCAGACEDVIVWDIRTGEKARILEGDSHMVTSITRSGNGHVAVGYRNGEVRIFRLSNGKCIAPPFSGHKSSVSCLAYDSEEGLRLASGGQDTNIIIWDVVNERGLYRLQGHKNEVLQVTFLAKRNILISSSRDSFVKFWDLDTQHCFKTLTEHTTSVGAFILCKDDSVMITGAAGQDLKVWKLKFHETSAKSDAPISSSGAPESDDTDEPPNKRIRLETIDEKYDYNSQHLTCACIGTITKEYKNEILSMSISSNGNLFGFHGNDSKLVIYRIRSDEEVEKRLKKRTKKLKKQAVENGLEDSTIVASLESDDLVVKIETIRTSFKLRAFQCMELGKGKAKIIALLKDNSFESYQLEFSIEKASVDGQTKFSMPGHRKNIQTICFSSDSSAIMTGSKESIRIWNRSNLKCIRSINSSEATSSTFAYGNKHVVIGTSEGHLEIYNILSGQLEDRIEAHTSIVRALALTPDKLRLASGGGDKIMILWRFEQVIEESDDEMPRRKLTLVPDKKIEMSDEILCLKYTANMKYMVVSYLNSDMIVFKADTMEVYRSLYGHAYAVRGFDISTDGTMLASGSIDKTIRIYDLDFVEVRKIIRCAHDEEIVGLQFLPNTHMFFSCGKDGKIKQWDGDTFQKITELQGHHNPVTCMAISPNGQFVVSSADDKSVRLWEKTDEIIVLSEEQEMEREKEAEEQEEEIAVPGEWNDKVAFIGAKNAKTETSADKLIEALDNLQNKDSVNQNLIPLSGPNGVLEVIKKIPSCDLEETLLLLPFSYVQQLFPMLASFIEKESEIELLWRCVMLLLRVHVSQITSNQVLLPVLEKLHSLRTSVKQEKDLIGINYAGLLHLKQKLEDRDSHWIFASVVENLQKKKKGRRQTALSFRL